MSGVAAHIEVFLTITMGANCICITVLVCVVISKCYAIPQVAYDGNSTPRNGQTACAQTSDGKERVLYGNPPKCYSVGEQGPCKPGSILIVGERNQQAACFSESSSYGLTVGIFKNGCPTGQVFSRTLQTCVLDHQSDSDLIG